MMDLRKMAQMGNTQKVRQMVWSQMEQQVYKWFNNLRGDVRSSKNNGWKTDREAKELVGSFDSEKEAKAVGGSINEVKEKVARLVLAYIEQQQNPTDEAQRVKAEAHSLLKEFHNPSTKEALLMAVKDEYKADVRQLFDEVGMMMWGLVDMMQGRQSEEFWFVLNMVSNQQDVPLAVVVRQINGVEESDIPEAYR